MRRGRGHVNRSMHAMHVDRATGGRGDWSGNRARKIGRLVLGEGENVFIKGNVTRHNHTTSGKMEATIAFVRIGIAKKNTRKRVWFELVSGSGG